MLCCIVLHCAVLHCSSLYCTEVHSSTALHTDVTTRKYVMFIAMCCTRTYIRRASAGGSGVSVEARVLATLLTEMDGISSGNSSSGSGEQGDMRVEESVIVMAATNRIDCIDAALLRKGRFHQTLFVPPPSPSEKVLLLHYFAKRCRLLEGDVQCIQDSESFKRKGISGADVEGMCKERLIASVRLPVSVGQLELQQAKIHGY